MSIARYASNSAHSHCIAAAHSSRYNEACGLCDSQFTVIASFAL